LVLKLLLDNNMKRALPNPVLGSDVNIILALVLPRVVILKYVGDF
jgi:hypothetical protein